MDFKNIIKSPGIKKNQKNKKKPSRIRGGPCLTFSISLFAQQIFNQNTELAANLNKLTEMLSHL